MITTLFVILGIAVGGAQATLLARRTGLALRLGIVAAVLLVATAAGQLAPAAIGWLIGYLAACRGIVGRQP